MPPRRRAKRKVRPVILIAAEGYVEKAFLSMLKEHYSDPRYKVEINNRKGGSSDQIVIFSCQEADDYYRVAAIVDSDKPISKKYLDRAYKRNVSIVQNTPCIEGTLLDILGANHDNDSNNCKKEFLKIIGQGKSTYNGAHKKLFTKETLDEARKENDKLDRMIKIIQGLEV